MSALNPEKMRHLLHYDPESGLFTWIVRTARCVKVGDVAGSVDNRKGYLRVALDGKTYLAHRLAHLWMTGEFPVEQIDHVNGVRNDNRWENLREASNQQNGMNQRKRGDNSSGFKGVSRDGEKWKAQIMLDGRSYHIGYFDSPEEASRWYEGAAAILFGDWKRITVETKVTYER